MKKLISSVAIVFIAGYVGAQSVKHTWNATIKVLNEAGQPIVGANVEMEWYINTPNMNTTYGKTDGLTDTNGIFKTSHEVNGSISLGFFANKKGYYQTRTSREAASLKDINSARWNYNITLILKKIVKQIPMYAKQITSLTFPECNKPIGYDFTIGDWIAPYGKGIKADIYFTENHQDDKSGYTFTYSFPRPGDGIQEFIEPASGQNVATGQSDLKSFQFAPTNGYSPTFVQTNYNQNRIYYFRIRTILGKNGHIKSALYGKIYGNLPQITYYLDPTPNDRNVEFDPKHNLLSGLKSFQQVNQP